MASDFAAALKVSSLPFFKCETDACVSSPKNSPLEYDPPAFVKNTLVHDSYRFKTRDDGGVCADAGDVESVSCFNSFDHVSTIPFLYHYGLQGDVSSAINGYFVPYCLDMSSQSLINYIPGYGKAIQISQTSFLSFEDTLRKASNPLLSPKDSFNSRPVFVNESRCLVAESFHKQSHSIVFYADSLDPNLDLASYLHRHVSRKKGSGGIRSIFISGNNFAFSSMEKDVVQDSLFNSVVTNSSFLISLDAGTCSHLDYDYLSSQNDLPSEEICLLKHSGTAKCFPICIVIRNTTVQQFSTPTTPNKTDSIHFNVTSDVENLIRKYCESEECDYPGSNGSLRVKAEFDDCGVPRNWEWYEVSSFGKGLYGEGSVVELSLCYFRAHAGDSLAEYRPRICLGRTRVDVAFQLRHTTVYHSGKECLMLYLCQLISYDEKLCSGLEDSYASISRILTNNEPSPVVYIDPNFRIFSENSSDDHIEFMAESRCPVLPMSSYVTYFETSNDAALSGPDIMFSAKTLSPYLANGLEEDKHNCGGNIERLMAVDGSETSWELDASVGEHCSFLDEMDNKGFIFTMACESVAEDPYSHQVTHPAVGGEGAQMNCRDSSVTMTELHKCNEGEYNVAGKIGNNCSALKEGDVVRLRSKSEEVPQCKIKRFEYGIVSKVYFDEDLKRTVVDLHTNSLDSNASEELRGVLYTDLRLVQTVDARNNNCLLKDDVVHVNKTIIIRELPFSKSVPENGVLCFFWDCEATGLSIVSDDITQIGCISRLLYNDTWDELKSINAEFSCYVSTEKEIPEKVLSLTGKTREFLKEYGIPLCDALERWRQWCAYVKSACYRSGLQIWFVAHNGNRFDLPLLLQQEHDKCGWYDSTFLHKVGTDSIVDTVVLSRRLAGSSNDKKSHRLCDLYCEAFKCVMPDEHDALGDVKGLFALMKQEPFHQAWLHNKLAWTLEEALEFAYRYRDCLSNQYMDDLKSGVH